MISEQFETIVIIPNFNGFSYLAECLNSLRSQTYDQFKTIVIDDHSSDDSVNYLQKNWPEVEVLALEKNVGFAKAVNLGIKYARNKYQPKYLAILNNDTKVDTNWLKNLIIISQKNYNVLAVASNMFFYDYPDIINSQGGKFTFTGQGLDINFNQKKSLGLKQSRFVLASCWGATLIKSQAFDLVGFLDENYYAYFEDLDWGYRANLFGYKIIFSPEAVVYHKGSAFWNNFPYQKTYLCRRNALYLILKNYQWKNIFKASPAIITNYVFIQPLGYLLNRKRENSRLTTLFDVKKTLLERLRFVPLSYLAIIWNIKNLPRTLMARRKIQNQRKINDEEIFKLSEI